MREIGKNIRVALWLLWRKSPSPTVYENWTRPPQFAVITPILNWKKRQEK